MLSRFARLLERLLLAYMQASFSYTMKGVYQYIESLLEEDPSHHWYIDFGCNNGHYTKRLAKKIGTHQIIGLEIDKEVALEAKRRGIAVIISDLNDPLPFKNDSIHTITSLNLLEHLLQTHIHLSEVVRILSPGGYIVINTPNLASWHNIGALLCGYQPFSGPNISSMLESDFDLVKRMNREAHGLPYTEETLQVPISERYRHIIVIAYRSLRKKIKELCLQIETAHGFGYYPLPPFLSRIFASLNPAHSHHIVIKAVKPKQEVGKCPNRTT